MRPANIVKLFQYFTVPPAASIAALAFSLTAFTLKVNFVFISPLPKFLPYLYWLINR